MEIFRMSLLQAFRAQVLFTRHFLDIYPDDCGQVQFVALKALQENAYLPVTLERE
jgi:hypothetical protein